MADPGFGLDESQSVDDFSLSGYYSVILDSSSSVLDTLIPSHFLSRFNGCLIKMN
jgi:hypothetical protein